MIPGMTLALGKLKKPAISAGGELIPRFKIFFQHKSTKIRKRVYTFRTSYIKIP